MSTNKPLTYKDAGVDIDAGNELVERIKPHVRKTMRPEVLAGLGGFGGMFALPPGKFQEPVLVSGTDGVGTKLMLAQMLDVHDSIGIDLVAMCVNDLIVAGAEPLFFLDYYATGELDVDVASDVVAGIGEGCQQAGCALIGGETAEMPGMYAAGDYDLAGFCVGIVEEDGVITGEHTAVGDSLIALGSSGPHSNGYSLIRKILDVRNIALDSDFNGRPLAEVLLTPTRIYTRSLLAIIQKYTVHALAHITGGGLLENIPRVLPEHCQAVLRRDSWQLPPIFEWLQQQGNISDEEMQRTFNCGVGMIVAVPKDQATTVVDALQTMGEQAWEIGHIAEREPNTDAVVFR